MISDIAGLSFNTLTADDKYSLHNRKNLLQPIRMQLSKKQKNFLELFCAFLKSRLKFEHFEEKNDPHRVCISETTEYKKCD